MSNALAVEALLHLVRVMEAAEAAERAHQEAREAELMATTAWRGEKARTAAAAAQEQVMSWQDEIGRARADVLWQLGQHNEDWSSWLRKHTSLDGVPPASGAA
ncbi:hypothetical protein FHR75_003996 [Kineococcus radiotolerans]|uniref:Uncharacterized protein n=1 Tax=Kineococcus radiotolerans TaxID=131568 RepID=A0A7W4XZC8_KINRA|nr:hypothetical protein [Kineococcus radiotolerans]MBB2903154.1 hypothetical protein [Kineococcus radiotolerans]